MAGPFIVSATNYKENTAVPIALRS